MKGKYILKSDGSPAKAISEAPLLKNKGAVILFSDILKASLFLTKDEAIKILEDVYTLTESLYPQGPQQ